MKLGELFEIGLKHLSAGLNDTIHRAQRIKL
jgi:hypothetical protein